MSQQFDSETVMNNVESLKSRIIKTDKLLSNLTAAREELQVQTNTIKSLQDSLASSLKSTKKYQTEFSLLETKYNNLKNLQNGNTNDLSTKLQSTEQKINVLMQEKNKAESNAQSRILYIQQLEAKCEALQKGSGGNQQNTELKKLHQELNDKNKELTQLKSELEEERESSEKTEDVLMELQIDNDMLKADYEEKVAEFKAYKEKHALMQQKSTPPTFSQDVLTSRLFKAEEKAKRAEEKLIKAEEKALKDKEELTKAEDRALKAEDRAAKAEERAYRAENNNRPASIANNSEELDALRLKYRGLQADLNMTKSYNEHLQQQLRALLLKEDNIYEDSGSSSVPLPLSPQTIPHQVQATPSTSAQLQTNITPETKTTPLERPRPPLKTSNSKVPSIYMKKNLLTIPEHKKENPHSKNQPTVPPIQKSARNLHQPSSNSSSNAQQTTIPQVDRRRLSSHSQDSFSETLPHDSVENPQKRKRIETSPTMPKSDRSALRVSGMIPPAPVIQQRPPTKGKKTMTKLERFVNSRNPSKIIGTKQTPVSKKKTQMEVLPVVEDDHTAKKAKVDNKYLKIADQATSTKHVIPTCIDVNSELDAILSEMEACFEKIKSVANPSNLSDTTFGIMGGMRIKVPGTIDKREKLYAWLLWVLVYDNKEIYQKVTQKIYNIIVQRCHTAKQQSIMMRYTRTLAILFKEKDDMKRMQDLCFDVIRHSKSHINTMNLLQNIACIYKDCLQGVKKEQDIGEHLVRQSICSVVKFIVSSFVGSTALKENINATYLRIISLLEWPEPENTLNLDAAIQAVSLTLKDANFKTLHYKEQGGFEHIRFCIVKSLELLFRMVNDWPRTYDYIETTLWPLLQMNKVDNICLELFGKLGSFGLNKLPEGGSDHPHVNLLLKSFVKIINIDSNGNTAASKLQDLKLLQHTAVDGIILLAKNKPEYIKLVKKWLSRN